ncbi:MAG: SymE family type I addiction module toxin [Lachnospiraceae bacterium]|nr:SymE family type I addiction module toxin [Lachnospiraceae bacterium]
MAKARKEYRELTVSEATNYGRKTAPMLRIQGLWFQELGFNIGDPVLVKCEDGKLVIMRDTTRAELKEAEKAFMEEETRKLHERFLKEKKELHTRFVAERKSNYCMVAETGSEAAYV